MGRITLAALSMLVAAVAGAQPLPPGMPRPPGPPPVYVPAPRVYVPGPHVYVPGPRYYPPRPLYVPRYVQPLNPYYARKATIYRGIGIPLLSVGVPLAVAGGIVWIVGAACRSCSDHVTWTGVGLFGAGVALFVPGAILTGIGNYYHWMARVTARADFGVAFARDRGAATVRFRF